LDARGARNSIAASFLRSCRRAPRAGQNVPALLVRCHHPWRVIEGFERRDAAVTVAVGSLIPEGLDEKGWEPRLVAFAAGLRRRDDDAPGTGEADEGAVELAVFTNTTRCAESPSSSFA
jgi:hypothetical protein